MRSVPAKPPRINVTIGLLQLIGVLQSEPGHSYWYGYEIMKKTEMPSGKLYPMLHRLEAAGWIESRFEDGTAQGLGRPLRRMYSFTELGQEHAERLRWAASELRDVEAT